LKELLQHISKFLLKEHINPEIGVASRTSADIDKTVGMIDKMVSPGNYDDLLRLWCIGIRRTYIPDENDS
jgi:hypothetical protein